jgi:hypothetical protein
MATANETNSKPQVTKPKPEERRVYASLEEAKKHPVPREGWHLCQITDPSGRVRFTWCNGWHDALRRIAMSDGYIGVEIDKMPSKEKVEGMLAAMTAEDRALLLQKYIAKAKK